MSRYSYCFFDLDGTITDSAPGIIHSVEYAMKKANKKIPEGLDMTLFIGPPLLYGFSVFCGLDENDTVQAVEDYREYYRAGGMFECRVYEGIRSLLKKLNATGVRCVLATCKPHEFANAILDHFDLLEEFCFVSGPEMDGTRNEKHEVIAYALEKLNIASPREVLMVGDRDSDILGAKQNAVDGVGVTWGFGTREELEAAGALGVIDFPEALLSYFEQNQ
ncbi:MAG: HAD hydrolase-like protein [Clostridia bacterium]|nr:HAD hydrolase-like protein [Clostridia bacterium]